MIEQIATRFRERLAMEWDVVREDQMQICRELARVALQTIRQPNEAMEAAYDRACDAAHLGEALTAERAWEAMIDAALEIKR